jgi:formate dehydrogenase maturation protein FdhE
VIPLAAARTGEVGEGILVRHTRRSMVLDGTVRAAHVRDHYRRRYLRYALCATRWTYRRLGCPACGNTEEARLERLLAEDDPGWRLDLCSKCHLYLKTADIARVPDPELYALAAWGWRG